MDWRTQRIKPWSRSSCDYPILVKRDFKSVRWRFDEVPDATRYERYYLTHKAGVRGGSGWISGAA